MLVDVDRLVSAYYEEQPDPGEATQQVGRASCRERVFITV